jgi:glutathione S-transferase kappa 1
VPPKDLMAEGNTVVPLRALHYIKRHHDKSTYLSTWHFLFNTFWTRSSADNEDRPRLGDLATTLRRIPQGYDGPDGAVEEGAKGLLFSDEELVKIMAATKDQEYKDLLKGVVEQALLRGAFGAPWIWVTDSRGRSQPFFGSDRYVKRPAY